MASVSATTSHIRDVAREARDYIAKNSATSTSTSLGRVSRFWRDVLGARPPAPGLNDLLAFRRSAFAYGIGDDRMADDAAEEAQARRMACMIDQFVPRTFLGGLVEPSHGAPLIYSIDDLAFSASFRVNAGTSYRVCELLRRFGGRGKALRVCEIGPGWGGCAIQLLQLLDIATYVLIDLPDNLFLSSTYLAGSLPNTAIEFLDVAGPSYTPPEDNRVVAMLPPAVERLACRFDLILNSFSLQEMEADTVDAYLSWATRSLADDGVLISFNAHGKAGIARASDYRFGRFTVRHIRTFRRVPSGLLNTIPYEVVLSRRPPGMAAFDERAFAVLADLVQLGLDDELVAFEDGLVGDTLTVQQKSFLQTLDDCLSAGADERREGALAEAARLDSSAIVPFVRGNLQFAAGTFELAEASLATASARKLGGFARLRCDLMRAIIRTRGGHGAPGNAILLPDDPSTEAAMIYPEIPRLVASGDPEPLQGQINRVFRRTNVTPPRRSNLWLRRKRSSLASDRT